MDTTITAANVKLSHTNPVDGKPNPYRTRWFEHDGVVFKVESDRLDGIWCVSTDDDLIGRLIDSPNVSTNASDTMRRKLYRDGALLDYIRSDANVMRHAVRLSDAREFIAEWINSPEWPAIRDAYRALRADLDQEN